MEQKFKPYIMYKITCNDNNDLIYIGSTLNFRRRKWNHKYDCTFENGHKYNLKVYKSIRENGGWSNFTMKPIEMYYADSKIKSKIRETQLMEAYNSNLNSHRAWTDIEKRKELNKAYCIENKEKIDKYVENNKERTAERRKLYGKTYNKNYYESNKERLLNNYKEKITCECGCEVTKCKLNRHLLTKKHITALENIK